MDLASAEQPKNFLSFIFRLSAGGEGGAGRKWKEIFGFATRESASASEAHVSAIGAYASVPSRHARLMVNGLMVNGVSPHFQTALRADHILGSETLFEKLRRGRDSNPRYPLRHTVFPGLRTRPLCDLSIVTLLIVFFYAFLFKMPCR